MISVTPYSARQLVAHGPWIRGGRGGKLQVLRLPTSIPIGKGPESHTFRE